jgi:hypothetical protein
MGTAASATELQERAEKFVLENRWAATGDALVFVFGAHLVPGADCSVSLRRVP